MRTLILAALPLLTACSDHFLPTPPMVHEVGAAVAASSIQGNTTAQAGPANDIVSGPNAVGVAVPTAESVGERIRNGLEGNVNPTQGNFSRSLASVRTNLPKVRNLNDASGFDQIQLLAYAACSDLTTGGTPLMQTVYGVQANASIATNQTALVNAGMRMLDQHTGGIASQGPVAAQLTTIYTNLVQAQAAAAGTSRMAFMAVCIAASTAGSTLLGM